MLVSLARPADGTILRDPSTERIKELLAEKATLWLDFTNPTDKDFSLLDELFAFHPLAIDDVKSGYHLSKVDVYSDYIFLIWHALKEKEVRKRIAGVQVDVFLGHGYLVSVHKEPVEEITHFFERCERNPDIMAKGADWLLHTLLDEIVDAYFPVLDRISDAVDRLEEAMFQMPTEEQIKKLFVYKHQLFTVHKIAAPEREVINVLSRRENPLISDEYVMYFQNVYDHLVYITDLVETSREVVSGAADIYLSNISNRLNEVMKRLTVVATIFMPLTLISSIYGMNFRNMPELRLHYGYYFTLGLMLVVGIGMLVGFKRRNWW